MKFIIVIFFTCACFNIFCMEDFFGIKQISYQNEHGHHVREYRLGNILVSQTMDTAETILNYAGKIILEDTDNQILGPQAAQSTFTKLTQLLETEKQLLAQKAARKKEIFAIKG